MGPSPAAICPKCGSSNSPGSLRCKNCDSAISQPPAADSATVTNLDWSRVSPNAPAPAAQALEVGTVLSERYEILHLLGQGGMGAVYKARDIELDRLVALKVIRPELCHDPNTLRRFKQELILARQVTHKNVIRIFDLVSHHNTKFITMEYVEGRDLSSIVEDRRLSADEAARVVRQVCRALEAAHDENVIHRDLKPQNIMVDPSGRVRVMDFGLARSVEMSPLTQTGAILGTPAYMSPEQAQGQRVDARSDLFSLGIIFYELLTGQVPFKADTIWASLLARTKDPPSPPVALDRAVPQALSDIAMRCLAIDPAARYQRAAELAADLDAWIGDVQSASVVMPPPAPVQAPSAIRRTRWLMAGLALLACVAVIGGIVLRKRPVAAPPRPISVLVADFENHTGDPVFDGTLEPMFNVALEQARFINAYSRGDAHRLAKQLPHPSDRLDEQSARLIAVSQGLGAVVIGSLGRRGDGYRLSIEALDAATGRSIAHRDEDLADKDKVLLAVPKLAAPVRRALGDRTASSAEREAEAGAFRAASVEVVHLWGVAMDQQFAGKWEDALQSFSRATELDPNFARAWGGMAAISANLNRPQDAQKYLKLAMEHVDRMTERERYRTRGYYYRKSGDLKKCVEEYSDLVRQYPADNIGHQNLANCYSDLRDMPKALEEEQRAVEISPKAALLRGNLALIAAYAGDFRTAEREARAALQINPSYERPYLPLAYSQILQGRVPEAADIYRQLEKTGGRFGASFAVSGLADLALYEGRFSDAVHILEQGAAADLPVKNLLAPEKFTALAYVQLLRGEKKRAIAAADRALESSSKENIRFLVARILVAAGQIDRARALAAGLASNPQLEPQADAKLIAGEIALQSGDPHAAVKTFIEANQLLDTWIGRFDLARAYLEAGQFTEADSELDRCIKRRGEALELYDGPTFGYFPPVYALQGRVREGLKSPGAADSYRTYLAIRGKAGEDPSLPDLRRRAAPSRPLP